MFRQVRSGEWNLKLCSQSIYTAQTASVRLHIQPQILCRGQPAPQFRHFQFYCSLQFLDVYVFGKYAMHIKFVTRKKKYKDKLKNLKKDNKLCDEKGKEENKAIELTPGTQTVLFEEHVLSGYAEVFPTLVMLLSKIIMLWLLPHVRH